ncbi:HlyD family efflux transporter periplasmic adaptor subunit [Massilia terrae]|uniref:HlyD family efflux transporter periplasmic adaptor subunit n=2 Tax=Massilia terrae TaxID=1811224 RepID=A0ABT2CSF9_9BURK|nr:HlyD family efflux transporter periplasmic adaptor subunit [Massilia terrae]MCS0656891.1 HlyD family efflux transporter periplasmic adaptor subunit [Massilia terrae]
MRAAWLAILLVAGCAKEPANTYQGYVEGEFVYMASSQPGQLVKLAVARGQTVSANALLFELESANEADAVRQAQQQLQAAQAQRADLATGRRPQEVNVTQAQLQQARAEAERLGLQRQRDEAQYRAGGIARAQLDDTRTAASAAQARVRELEAQVQVARLPGREQQMRAQQAQVDAARAALGQAQWKLAQKQVHALDAGLVYDTLYRSGEWVPAGSPVVRMLPPANVKVRFFVPETAVGALAPGRKLQVRCDGCAAAVPATISFVSNQSEYTPPVIYSNATRSKLVFMVEARPAPEDAPKLRPGQPVEAVLQ